MKLRRLLLLSAGPEIEALQPVDKGSGSAEDSSWDLVAELDRLRSANTGLSAEVDRQTQIGQDYARVASEQRFRVEELERENAIAHTNCQMLERRLAQAEERATELEELVAGAARRLTARARCSIAPAAMPPARMNRRSGGSPTSSRSIHSSSRATSCDSTAAFSTRAAILCRGSASLAPSANRSRWIASSI